MLTTDVDEIVAPLPEWGGLDAYMNRLNEPFVNCFGYELLHMKDCEPRFRPELPVLAQLIKVHELPMYAMRDYWRFTPRGLQTLLERGGLVVAEIGHWGNRDCVVGNLDHWPGFRRWRSLRNEPEIPVQVWAFARRPD